MEKNETRLFFVEFFQLCLQKATTLASLLGDIPTNVTECHTVPSHHETTTS